MTNDPASDRALNAIARMNYLHSGYRRGGEILDADMLYTLSLFALEPPRWVKQYEWRDLTDMELCAMGTFWKSVGDAMMIPYDALPSRSTGWTDGLHWLEELKAWSLKYEASHMVPDIANKRLADHSVKILFWYMPTALRETSRVLAALLMPERLRVAMM